MPGVLLKLLLAGWLLWTATALAQEGFQVIPLGVAGGLEEDNLSAYLAGPLDRPVFVALDGGTLRVGVRRALAAGSVTLPTEEGGGEQIFLNKRIAAYLISHAHLDHVAGLVINATDDTPKPILATAGVWADLQNHLFNWRIWPNFADEGPPPRLAKYHQQILTPGQVISIADTGMTVEAWPLSHSHGYASTAFLLNYQGHYLLYCGDSGPDVVEKEGRLAALWQRIAPLIRENRLRGILIESAYPSDRPDHLLFGHLTPRHLLAELAVLGREVSLQGVQVIITHVKPGSDGLVAMQNRILAELQEGNSFGVNFHMARQGERLILAHQ
ncbi:MAG: 3',5'-cyclic-nucleotide phosphodiesterase [Magnetococcales bacterium]|nr:3',5'-cyclic-nucleotide phosphodiesterase [Magnetococcales bacterium]NGZ26593.1 3',5'-cyclic-nucleotide phosphodiesterase [Magnetococcales bacterium]